MRVVEHAQGPAATILMESRTEKISENTIAISRGAAEDQEERYINMASGWVITFLGWSIWGFIAGLNVYLIVILCLGR
jgi:Mn2+/Fe2+ NRAMP family transporter